MARNAGNRQALRFNPVSLIPSAENHIPAWIIGLILPFFEQGAVALPASGLPIQAKQFCRIADGFLVRSFDFDEVADRGVIQKDACLRKAVNTAVFFINEVDKEAEPLQDQTGPFEIIDDGFDLFAVCDP